MPALAPNNRLDYLDAVRAFALLLGIVFHASMSFIPIFIGWAVMDISTSSIVSNFILVSHSFRMELFFLIAGFFSHMTFDKKGISVFIKSRLMRIAIPFVVGWFILRPLIIASWAMGSQSLQGEVNILDGLKIGFQSLEQLPTDLFTGSHLWFLYYILLITAITLAIRAVGRLFPRLQTRATAGIDQAIEWITDSRFSLIILSLPTGVCLWHMSLWGMDTPDKSLIPHWPVLIVYSGFFAFGWFLDRKEGLIERFARLTLGRGALCIAAIWATIVMSTYQAKMGHPHIDLIRAGFVLSYAIMMWSLVSLSIGLFKRLFDKPSKIVRYIADSSYWLYLIHLPIVVWLQIAFAELSLHWSLKLSAISILTIGISLALYDLFVRSTLIGKTLNGRRQERILFKWRTNREAKPLTSTSNSATENC